jgi:GR25 family glycosyltransferase involved in LPS biosynthesis
MLREEKDLPLPPHIYVISLLDTPTGQARWKKLRHRLVDQLGYPPSSITVLPAVHGKLVSHKDMIAVTTPLCSAICTPSIVGCALSHINIWKLIKQRNLPYALVLEDDVDLKDDFVATVREAISTPPDPNYHLLLLGCFFCNGWIQRYLYGQNPSCDQAPQWVKIKTFRGTHAYICSQQGARFLLDAVRKSGGIRYPL